MSGDTFYPCVGLFSLYIIQLEVLSNEFECSVSGGVCDFDGEEEFFGGGGMLFISQSCLSKHIKKLETEIGVELFERTTRTVVLTVSVFHRV